MSVTPRNQEELFALCEHGAKAIRNGTHDALEFRLFNGAEADVVKGYMADHYPNVPYQIKRIC